MTYQQFVWNCNKEGIYEDSQIKALWERQASRVNGVPESVISEDLNTRNWLHIQNIAQQALDRVNIRDEANERQEAQKKMNLSYIHQIIDFHPIRTLRYAFNNKKWNIRKT